MDFFQYKNSKLHCESVDLRDIADKYQTPLYVYSQSTLRRHCQVIKDAFAGHSTLVCFAMKSNSNLSILEEVFNFDFGADVVSGGELGRALAAKCHPNKIIYSGVGKEDWEIQKALEVGIYSFNVESLFELDDIARIAKTLNKTAPISIRLNPDIDAKTNPKIATGLYSTKFGISEDQLAETLTKIRLLPQLNLIGIGCHIGSQITELQPLQAAAKRIASIAQEIKKQGFQLKFLDMGGGLGIRYKQENPPTLGDYANCMLEAVKASGLQLVIEPGRVIVGNTGIILTKVIGVKKHKDKSFVIVDAAMNDLLRPTLYEAYHDVWPYEEAKTKESIFTDIVGPICETGDFLAKNRALPELHKGDLLAIRTTGAYASSMASNYNSRCRAAEVLVKDDDVKLIRRREKTNELWKDEINL